MIEEYQGLSQIRKYLVYISNTVCNKIIQPFSLCRNFTNMNIKCTIELVVVAQLFKIFREIELASNFQEINVTSVYLSF